MPTIDIARQSRLLAYAVTVQDNLPVDEMSRWTVDKIIDYMEDFIPTFRRDAIQEFRKHGNRLFGEEKQPRVLSSLELNDIRIRSARYATDRG